jgi:Glycosyl hydrolases family 2, sugar binding domain/Glycosyl hydrolases family 2/Glycosyl hydrolases family 2, TIM barrel domain
MARLSNRILILLLAVGWFAPVPLAAQIISLDGNWIFVPDPAASLKVADLPTANGIPVRVPSSWQAAFVDRRDYAGVAWYWRNVSIEQTPAGHLLFLRFGAVDYRADVYVNGQMAGTHDGGYLPFEFDITSLVHPGDNQIAVRVVDASAKLKEVEGIKYAEIPHGKQNWYVETSGLWQNVELELRPRSYLGTIHVTADAGGDFKIRVPIQNPAPPGQPVQQLLIDAEIFDPAQKPIWQGRHELDPNEGVYEFAGKISNATLWDLANPALYTLHVKLNAGSEQSILFGFRTFEARGGKFYLNGKPIYLRAALDQAFYPDTVYTPPSLDYLRDEMRKAKALGLNMLRCHIKVPDPRYLKAADEEGVLVWYEIPNWDKLTADSESRALETLRGMVDRDWNHPSIVIVSIINESWGIDLKSAPGRAWLKSAYLEAKKIVPGWLVDDNSACCDNFHVQSDLADFHQYNAIPDHAGDFDRLVGDFSTRPSWLFSPYGDAEPKGDEPLVLSEFGNWGLPRLHEPEPWWFARDFGGRQITLPAGVEKRFTDHQYGSLFPDFNALAGATEQAQLRSLKYEIGSLRMHPEIQGYVITEFTDVDWESNGLLDMWRQPKFDVGQMKALQQDDLVVVRAEKRNDQAGEPAEAQVYFSHYGANSLSGAMVSWELEGTDLHGDFPLPAMNNASVVSAGRIQFTAPSETTPSRNILKVRVTAGGKAISEDTLDFYFYPPKTPDLPPPVSFHDPAGRLRRLVNEMRERGYQPPSGRESFPVLISSVWDDEVKQALRGGAIVLLIPTDPMTLAPGLEVVPRSKDDLGGNWISSFLWIRSGHAPFRQIGFETLPGFEVQPVVPNTVLEGVPPEHFDDVLSGFFYGWIHSNVGTLVQAQCGKGKLLISTFALGTTYGTDPYATYFLDALMNYAVGGFTPRYRIPLDDAANGAPQ